MRRPLPLLSFEGNQEKPISSRRRGFNIQSKQQCDGKISLPIQAILDPLQSMDNNCGDWVERMGVASGGD